MTPGDDLTPRARELLDILIERGGWVTRTELAQAVDKRDLSDLDMAALESMAAKGLIMIYVYHIRHKGVAVEYRAK